MIKLYFYIARTQWFITKYSDLLQKRKFINSKSLVLLTLKTTLFPSLNCGVGEDSWESLGLQGDPTQSILKEINPGISLEGMMLKLKLQYFGHLMRRVWLIGKDSDDGRDWGQEKGTTQDEMAGWHHGLNGRESEWTPGVGDGQGGLACCDSWGRKESDTEQLNWTDIPITLINIFPGA